jgi:hypothetical protein
MKREVTGSQETNADRKTTGLGSMFHCCMASGRRKKTPMAYMLVQPDRYIQGVSCEKKSHRSETRYFEAAPFVENVAVINFFPFRGAFNAE